MPKILRNLRIDDVSSVDVGAGRGVKVVLHKRDSDAVRAARAAMRKHRDGVPAIYGKPLAFGADIPADALAYLKRDYSDDQRQEMAESGEAQDDGSYPIKNTKDLHNAIQAVGRSKNPAKTKAHIKARAKDLGATDALPEDWTKAWSDEAREAAAEARRNGGAADPPERQQTRRVMGRRVTYDPNTGKVTVGKAGNEDEERDDHGRWTSGGGGGSKGTLARSREMQDAKRRGLSPRYNSRTGRMEYEDRRNKRDVPEDELPAIVKVLDLVDEAVGDAIAKSAVDFSEARQAADDCEDASDLMNCVRDAVCALDTSINSILCDPDVDDKAASIEESYDQFKTYIGGLGLEGDGDDDDDDKTEKRDMAGLADLNPQLRTTIEQAIAKAVSGKDEQIAKLEATVSYLKMKKEHQAYHDGLGSDTEKKKFTSMTDDERDSEMEKTRKRAEDDPIYKSMRAENEALQKRLQKIEDERDLEVCKRDAREMGLTQNDAGEVLMKMRRGDAEAIKKYEGYMVALAKAQNTQISTGRLFSEFGTARGNDGTQGESAMVLLKAKADELRQKDPNLTEAQAFDKAYNDPANMGLREQESAERMRKIHHAA